MAIIREVKTKKGIRYRAVVRVAGFGHKSKTFVKEKEAKHWAKKLEVILKEGKYKEIKAPNKTTTTIYTVTDLINYFQENIAPDRYANHAQYTHMYVWWKNKIGNALISDLTTSMLSQCKEILSAEPPAKPYKERTTKGNSTVNKYLFALSAILTYAVKELEIIDTNPMSNVIKKKKPKGRVRFLSEDELKALLPACKEHSEILYVFVLVTLATGARYSEVLNLKIENIDFKNEIFHFIDTKNGEDRGVPAYKDVLFKLKEYIKINDIESGFIFLNNKKSKQAYLRGPFEDVVKKLKIEDFHFHDLRHTAASYLAMNEASLLDISEILGHKTLNMVKRYAHLTKKHTSAVINKMGSNMLNI